MPSSVLISLLKVLKVMVPPAGAVHLNQTEAPPALPEMMGSPAWRVAAKLLVITMPVGALPRSHALAKSSLSDWPSPPPAANPNPAIPMTVPTQARIVLIVRNLRIRRLTVDRLKYQSP